MPAEFTDAAGRKWPLELDFPDISRIKKETSVDLMTEEGLASLGQLKGIEDYERVTQVLYLAWQGQCEKYDVTDEDFGRLVSKHFVAAVGAFNEALIDFFHRVGLRPMARLIERAMAMSTEADAVMDTQFSASTLDRLLTKSRSIIERQRDEQLSQAEADLDRILGNTLPSSVPSAESSMSSNGAG